MEETSFSWKIIALIIIVIMIGGLIAASTIGWLDVGGILQKIPFVAKITDSDAQYEISLEEKNNQLKKHIAEQEKEIKQLKAEVKLLNQLEQDIVESKAHAEATAAEESQRRENYRELATYYAEMEPEAAVAIFNNLEQDVAAIILQAMSKDQAGKIFSVMDPKQAADLLNNMANLEPLEET